MKNFGVILVIILGFASNQTVRSEPNAQAIASRHVPQLVQRLIAVSEPDAAQRLNISITLPLQNTNELRQLLRDLYDPANPRFRKYLSADEFTARFGPSQSDYDTLIAYCKSQGMTVVATHPNRTSLSIKGSVKEIEVAFQTKLRNYQHPTENRLFYAPEIEPKCEAPVPLLHIHGLDNLDRPKSQLHSTRVANVITALNGSGVQGMYMGNDFRRAYAPGVTLTGAGQSLALVEFDAFYPADIKAYATKAGLPDVPLQTVAINGFTGVPGSGNGEVALDIEIAMSMAPGLQQIIVYEADQTASPYDLLNRIANDNIAKQISCSWTWTPNDQSLVQVFQQFAAQGQSFLTASGDSDAYSGSISAPADNPYVTSVGGTHLTMTSGWASETTWNDRASGFGTGGGISSMFGIPDWQTSISMAGNGGSTQFRNIPDVAMVADNVMSISDNGVTYNNSGTSISAPLWAGFVALANQQATAGGQPSVGFINPSLYAMGNSSGGTFFHDITTGNNTSSASPNRFYATRGYDLCTGWGSPTGNSTISALLLGPGGQVTLDHFVWNLSTGSWIINSPIAATITAKTQGNSTWANFSGQLTLTAQSQDSGASVTIQPATITCKNGSWSGLIRVKNSAPGIVFTASDAQGHSGSSSPIDVAAQLAVSAIPANAGSITGNGLLVAGTSQSVLAVPKAGWKFVQWQDGDTENPRTVTMPATNMLYTATFAFVDRTPPKIAVTSRGGTYRGTNPAYLVTGTAADVNGIDSVEYRLNGGDWDPANGTTNWNGTVDLVPGINTIEAFSADASSNQSAIARIKINYVPTTRISVSTIGNGVVSPNLDGKVFDIGKTITLMATPAAGQIFDGWNNGVMTRMARFTVISNLSITAAFAPNPFAGMAGVYNGLWIPTSGPTPSNSGYITLTVTTSGAFSGKLLFGPMTAFTGQFRSDGTVQQSVARGRNAPWILNLTIGTNRITGQVTGADWVAEVQADRSPWNVRTNPAPFAGSYKLSIDASNFGSLVVTPAGSARVIGSLPDKSRVSQATTISADGAWPLHQSLYSGTGELIGWGQISSGSVVNQATWVGKTETSEVTIGGR